MTHARDLPATALGVPQSRAFVRDVLREHDLDGLVDTASLLVSELATNAVLHARSGYRVEVSVLSDRVRISVLDDSVVPAQRRFKRVDAGTGRGLGMVASLADAWGETAASDLGGRTKGIWFELPTDPALLQGSEEGSLYGEDWLAFADEL